jgi:ABC-type multidrug transport system ATPase subunit
MTALRIESLTHRFGATEAVSMLDLTVARGQVYGLLGPNGSGKTTTLSCALGMLRPDSGRIEILGLPVSQVHTTAGKIGAVFDAPTLVPRLSVGQNLGYARRLLGHKGGRTPEQVLEIVGLGDRERQRATSLSLGQQRRLAIARALLGTPELLVLDEPLSGLDTAGVRDVLTLVRQLADAGLTLLLSSHRLTELERVVDHVGIIMGGRMVREAPLGELLGAADQRLSLRTPNPQRAREVLGESCGAGWDAGHTQAAGDHTPAGSAARPGAAPSGSPDTLLQVHTGGIDPAVLNRRLLEAGCEISALVPARPTLQTVFEDLLDAQLAGSAD